jgi:site-specific recombinase XerD
MAVATKDFFKYIDEFFNYRHSIYELSHQTVKSNRVDLNLFKNFIESQNQKTICGPAVIDFQYYLKYQRNNCGASINRKIHTLRSYANFLKLYRPSGTHHPGHSRLRRLCPDVSAWLAGR